jgi:NDP-sugar pyrophosphorylase family protein
LSAQVRNAFVLGAGLGARLRGITARRPKPLIPICQRPLISFAFDHLLQSGITRLVVNMHHCAEQYARFFPDNRYMGTSIAFRHEPELLETAGGIKNVADLLGGEPFIVYNGDILTDLPLERAVQHHLDCGNEVTLVLRSRDGPLHVSLDEKSGRVMDISRRLGSGWEPRFLFTGLYVVSNAFLARIPPRTMISVIPIFLEMIQAGAQLGGIVVDDGHWRDLGTREQYLEVHRQFARDGTPPGGQWIHPSAHIEPDAQISGATVVGANSRVGASARLHDCILWEDTEIASDSKLESCIVTAGRRVEGTHANADF